MARDRVRQYVLWVIAADYPLLYLGAITLESSPVTTATLAVLALAAAIAAWAY